MSPSSTTTADVLIIGAGLSGLTAARELTRHGLRVVVVEKGRTVGGRLATQPMGPALLDHGAQFFTVRGDDFAATVGEAVDAGVVHEWCRGFGEPDGYARYAGSAGMHGFAAWLASDLTVLTGVQIEEIRKARTGWTARAGANVYEAPTILLTAPVPQSLVMLDKGSVRIDSEIADQLSSVEYFATIALLMTLESSPAVPEPGGVQLAESEAFTFVADNRRKGISPNHAVTLHANHDYSLRRFDHPVEEVCRELEELAAPWIGDATVLASDVKHWRHAGPVKALADRVLVDAGAGQRLTFAGDAFGGPKVEGAFNSGLAAARTLREI